MTIRKIIKDWLESHGYDGLYRDDDDGCGCSLDEFPCVGCGNVGIPPDCKAGYKQPGGGFGPEKGGL